MHNWMFWERIWILSRLISIVSSPDMSWLPGVKSDKFSVLYTFVCILAQPCQAQASDWPLYEDPGPLIGRSNPLCAPWPLLIRIGFKLFSSSLYSSPTWINSESIFNYCDDTGAAQLGSLNVDHLSPIWAIKLQFLWIEVLTMNKHKTLHSFWLPSRF